MYHVYPGRNGAIVSHAEYNPNEGTHGRLTKKPPPLGSAASIGAAVEIAYAYLGREPSDAAYIVDDDDLIRDVIFNDSYQAEQTKYEKWLCSTITLLILCFTSFAASTFAGFGTAGLAVFCGVSLLYIVVTRSGIQNEVEGGVVCFIILVLLFFLLPALFAARDAYQRKNAADKSGKNTVSAHHSTR